MVKVTINEQEIDVVPGTSILQACEELGIEIPRFCFHDRLSVPANCRMCLVDVKNAPKPVASCAMPCSEGMVVETQNEKIEKARKGVMEFLLINHPLDCPICDQGGECDLQDQAMAYGMDRSRFEENKRAVKDKDIGPLVKTVMTRCIQCTRCIRFSDEIAGVSELGAFHRGEHMEIGTYIDKAVSTELSGNLIDICPVGALTSKPYAFSARPWELTKIETIDVMDAVGSNIRMDVKGSEVMRVLPRLNEDINEEWISDRTRFAIDGLKYQRLDQPYIREKGKLRPATWSEAFEAIGTKMSVTAPEKMAALAGDLCDAESMFCLKELLDSPNLDCRQDGAEFDTKLRAGYVFNTGIAGIEQADAILMIGTNPRWEAPLINARIRKRTLMGSCKIGIVGAEPDLNYAYEKLDWDLGDFKKVLEKAEHPMLILGMGALKGPEGLAVQHWARELAETYNMVRKDWNGFNVLHNAAGRVGGLEVGFVPQKGGKSTREILKACSEGEIELIYLLGVDEIDPKAYGKAFVIYQGHHGDVAAQRADVILPGAAYSEKTGIYVNTEGRAQSTRWAIFPPNEAKEDWAIIRALSEVLGRTLPYNSLADVRDALAKTSPVFANLDEIVPAKWGVFGKKGKLPKKITLPIEDFYLTNVITRSSPTMATCSKTFVKNITPLARAS